MADESPYIGWTPPPYVVGFHVGVLTAHHLATAAMDRYEESVTVELRKLRKIRHTYFTVMIGTGLIGVFNFVLVLTKVVT